VDLFSESSHDECNQVECFEETPEGERPSVSEAINHRFREETENGVSEVDDGNGHVSKYFKIIIVQDLAGQSLGCNKSHVQ